MPLKELERLRAVNKYLKINFSLEIELQKVVKTAAMIFDCPTALISFISEHTQHILFKQTFDLDETPRVEAFCNYTIEQNDVFVVEDTSIDECFINNPLMTNDPKIRFYAGVPLSTHDGHHLGSLCVIDQSPKKISDMKVKMLKMLSRQVMQLLEYDLSLSVLKSQYVEARKIEVKLHSFFESTSSEHIMLDRNYNILAFNKRLEDFVEKEYRIKIQKGMKITDFIRKNYLRDFKDNYKRALAGERIRLERLIQFGRDPRWYDVAYDPAFNEEGEIIGVSYNSTDITYRILEQNMITHHQNTLAKTAFLQSHELRKPVANIIGILLLLELDGHFQTNPELKSIQEDTMSLDEKIRTIVSITGA